MGAAVLIVVAVGAVAILVLGRTGVTDRSSPVAWSTLQTQDVHALVFDPIEPERLWFGHHGGLLASADGGRTWQPTGLRGVDAMNMTAPSDGFFQVAGHDVYLETTDGGRTWQPVPNDLPGLDLHRFAADPQDPAHAWAFSVGHGLFETTDRGRTWQLRGQTPIGALAAFVADGRTWLLAIDDLGLRRSDDGGRTWTSLVLPPEQPASLAVSPDGRALYVGTTAGLARSVDGGSSWTAAGLRAIAVALAVSPRDPDVIAAVDEQRRLFRSFDGGETWPGP